MDQQQVLSKDDVREEKFSVIFPNGVPDQWKLVQLANQRLFAFENGIWTGKKEPLIECPVIRNTNFSNDGSLNLSNVAVIPIEQRQLERKRLKWGDIIIERSGGGPQQPVGRVVIFNLTEGNYCFSNFTTRLRVIDSAAVDPRYLHLYLLYFHNSGQTEKLQNHTTGIRNLAFEEYKNSLIPLPPPSQQRAIFKVLQTVQKAIQARNDELGLERERKTTLMEYLFTYGTRGEITKQTEIGEIPESWQVVDLGEVCDSSAFGPRFSSTLYAVDGNIATLRTTDLDDDGNINYSTMPLAKLDNKQFEQHLLKPRDFLVTRSGTCGIAAVFEAFEKPVLPGAFLIRFRLSPQIDPYFLRFYVNSPFGRSRVLQLANGAVQKNLTGTSLRGLKIPLPSLDEQREIVNIFRACDAKIAVVEQEIMLLDVQYLV